MSGCGAGPYASPLRSVAEMQSGEVDEEKDKNRAAGKHCGNAVEVVHDEREAVAVYDRKAGPMSEEKNRDQGSEEDAGAGLDPAQLRPGPIAYAHCAGFSVLLSGCSAFLLAGTLAGGLLRGNSVDAGTVLLVGVCWFMLFLVGGFVGLPRSAIPQIEPLAAMRSLSIWRLVLIVWAYMSPAWMGPDDGGAVGSALCTCLLLGAVVDGVCLNRVALAWKAGLGGAVAISLRTALPLKGGGPPALPEGDGR